MLWVCFKPLHAKKVVGKEKKNIDQKIRRHVIDFFSSHVNVVISCLVVHDDVTDTDTLFNVDNYAQLSHLFTA